MSINDNNERLSLLIKGVSLCSSQLSLDVWLMLSRDNTPETQQKNSWCYSLAIFPFTSIIWRVWVVSSRSDILSQKAPQLRQTVLHPYRSSGPIKNNGLRQELLHQPSFVNRWFRRKHCSHLTLTVCKLPLTVSVLRLPLTGWDRSLMHEKCLLSVG